MQLDMICTKIRLIMVNLGRRSLYISEDIIRYKDGTEVLFSSLSDLKQFVYGFTGKKQGVFSNIYDVGDVESSRIDGLFKKYPGTTYVNIWTSELSCLTSKNFVARIIIDANIHD